LFEFISIDQPQKIRGRKRNILFINEANELTFESWMQLLIRTIDKVIIDYNPSMTPEHWIFKDVITRNDSDFYKSTYRDNPFLEPSLVAEIEHLQQVDSNYWKIYGLGEPGIIDGLIFPQFDQIDTAPATPQAYGLDFGYTNDPTALVAVTIEGDTLTLDEKLYRTHMRNSDIINWLRENNINRLTPIYADSAEPKTIDDLYLAGFNVHPATKGKDSIMYGIDLIRSYKLQVTKSSLNLIKELRNYTFAKDKEGKAINAPIDAFNHLLDASRYAVSMMQRSKHEYKSIMGVNTNTRRF